MCGKVKYCTFIYIIIYNILVQWQVTTLLVAATWRREEKEREKRNNGKGYEWMDTGKI